MRERLTNRLWEWRERLAWRVLPPGTYSPYGLTLTGRRFLRSVAVGLVSIAAGAIGLALLTPQSWQDVVAGALIGWGVSMCVWAVSRYRSERAATRDALREAAETDVLHERLNAIAKKVGARTLNLDWGYEEAVQARMERLAHYTGLEEFRPQLADTEDDSYADDPPSA